MYRNASVVACLVLALSAAAVASDEGQKNAGYVAADVDVLILSTNLAHVGVGEWGFSALVRVDGSCILFDSGLYPETVLENAARLDVDLSCVQDVVLSHSHGDHIGGVVTVVRELIESGAGSGVRVHVAERFFDRRRVGDRERTAHLEAGEALRSLGVEILEHAGPAEIKPGVWVTGPIARRHDERNWSPGVSLLEDGDWIEDYVPEDQALTVMTDRGHIVLVGCGHAGTVNTLEAVQSSISHRPIHALIGGLHLLQADEETLAWTAQRMASIGVANLMGGHCTGIEAVYRLRELAGLRRETAVVAAVGASFHLESGINPRDLAR